jgi:hypothetical protein
MTPMALSAAARSPARSAGSTATARDGRRPLTRASDGTASAAGSIGAAGTTGVAVGTNEEASTIADPKATDDDDDDDDGDSSTEGWAHPGVTRAGCGAELLRGISGGGGGADSAL